MIFLKTNSFLWQIYHDALISVLSRDSFDCSLNCSLVQDSPWRLIYSRLGSRSAPHSGTRLQYLWCSITVFECLKWLLGLMAALESAFTLTFALLMFRSCTSFFVSDSSLVLSRFKTGQMSIERAQEFCLIHCWNFLERGSDQNVKDTTSNVRIICWETHLALVCYIIFKHL